MKKLILIGLLASVLIIIAATAASATYTGAELIQEHTGETVNLYYETFTSSFGDQGGRNPNVVLRLFSDNPDEDFKDSYYAAVVYSDSDKDNFVILQNILHYISYDDSGNDYSPVGNYVDTDLDFSTSQANMPGFIYAVVSKNDGVVDSSDTFISINPSQSWLMGADGGEPCRSSGTVWLIDGECNIESSADSTYDSFDLIVENSKDGVELSVDKAYWYSIQGNVVEITRNGPLVIELIDTETDEMLDSEIASLGESVALDSGSAKDVEVYVNGIKTDELTIEFTETDTVVSSSNGRSDSSTSSSSPAPQKLKYEFEFEDSEIKLATVYLKSPVFEPDLSIEKQNLEYEEYFIDEYLVGTNIPSNALDEVLVTFEIERSLLRSLGISKSEVFVYVGNKVLTPEIIFENSEIISYYIGLTELSDFEIGNKEIKLETIAEEADISPIVEPLKSEIEQPQKTSTENYMIYYLAIIAVILIFVIFFLRRKKPKRKR